MRILLVLACVLSCASARADVLIDQPPVTTGLTGLLSNSSIGGDVAADTFTLAQRSLVTSVSWQGFVTSGQSGSVFMVRIYRGTLPPFGPPLAIAIVTATPTPDATVPGLFDYSANLSRVGELDAGRYVIAISGGGPNWYWQDGTGGDGQDGQFTNVQPDGPDPRHFSEHVGDLAFSLQGTTVPAPSSLFLLASAAPLLVWQLRKPTRAR